MKKITPLKSIPIICIILLVASRTLLPKEMLYKFVHLLFILIIFAIALQSMFVLFKRRELNRKPVIIGVFAILTTLLLFILQMSNKL